jgi:hemoglobin-like flavoprotein
MSRSFLNFRQGAAPAPGRGIAKTDYSDLDNSSLRARTRVQSPATNPTYVRPIHQTNGEQKMISPQDKQLLKTTWSMVAPISDVAAGLFYDRLFTLDPTLQRMFANADMKEQRRKLMQALAAVINGIDNLGALVPALENLGKNHVRYGVTDRHYDTVGAALLWTLEQGLKEAWTPAAKSAWTAAYTTVARVMRSAAAGAAEPAA